MGSTKYITIQGILSVLRCIVICRSICWSQSELDEDYKSSSQELKHNIKVTTVGQGKIFARKLFVLKIYSELNHPTDAHPCFLRGSQHWKVTCLLLLLL